MKHILALENKMVSNGLSNSLLELSTISLRNPFIPNLSKTLITGGPLKNFTEFLVKISKMGKRVGKNLWK